MGLKRPIYSFDITLYNNVFLYKSFFLYKSCSKHAAGISLFKVSFLNLLMTAKSVTCYLFARMILADILSTSATDTLRFPVLLCWTNVTLFSYFISRLWMFLKTYTTSDHSLQKISLLDKNCVIPTVP
ncbi:hypothetical protein GDO81_013957 [Engystomops pustulosus]|uniref:Uncharacterized protein n=1 Tax=Engystomops pustulosus TaxID=76066 RepID=A0AAV7B6Z9_ENGPU|nr:hypothetical protein GDO81_013957 [Engystomops pustulosus]